MTTDISNSDYMICSSDIADRIEELKAVCLPSHTKKELKEATAELRALEALVDCND